MRKAFAADSPDGVGCAEGRSLIHRWQTTLHFLGNVLMPAALTIVWLLGLFRGEVLRRRLGQNVRAACGGYLRIVQEEVLDEARRSLA